MKKTSVLLVTTLAMASTAVAQQNPGTEWLTYPADVREALGAAQYRQAIPHFGAGKLVVRSPSGKLLTIDPALMNRTSARVLSTSPLVVSIVSELKDGSIETCNLEPSEVELELTCTKFESGM